ncbi:ankyrin repeat-containing domain protein [Mycena crocata]|nr:ankyrin repeat-containing domain protein [Mycena crocata]
MRQPGTGEWLIKNEDFAAWKRSTGGTVMWCRGIPGAGKTVLASIVVDHLRNRFQGEDIGVACIYLNHKETETQSPPNLLASLWRQLVFDKFISPAVKVLHAEHHEKRTRPTINDILTQLSFTTAEYSKVYVVIDALDEYPEEERSLLLGSVATIEPRVHLMLTSRPHIIIPDFLPSVQVEIHATEDDIRSYVESRIQKSFRLTKHITSRPDLKEEIEKKVVQSVDGMFLLAKFHMDSFATKNTIKALRVALNNIPKDIEHTYNEAMERIDRQNIDDRNIARRILTWVANAKRPLSFVELQEALAVELNDVAFDTDNILDVDIILSVCAGLVIVDQSNQVDHVARLVHYTAQQYLDSIQHSHFPDAQVQITATCMTYLSFEIFANLANWSRPLPRWVTAVQEHPLLAYASQYCLFHAKGLPELLLKDTILTFLDRDFLRFFRREYFDSSDDTHELVGPLRIAAAFNLCEITRDLVSRPDNASDLDAVLCVASEYGSHGTTTLLINAGADVNSILNTRSPLHRAAKYGHKNVVRLLIENGADVDGITPPGLLNRGRQSTALIEASKYGHEEVVRLLLENGANVNFHGFRTGNALLVACQNAHEKTARILIEHGADVNLEGIETPVSAAARMGFDSVAKLLLENGARVDRALLHAAAAGYTRMVKLFVREYNADVNIVGVVGEEIEVTPLLIASINGHYDVVQILVENGANVNLQIRHRNALQAASYWGHESIVSFLIKNGADSNQKNRSSSSDTPLQVASEMGHQGIVQLLLDNGANPQDALQGAALYEETKVFELSITNSDSLNVWRRHRYNTSLGMTSVAVSGHKRDYGSSGNLLTMAAAQGSKEVVHLLIQKGADVNKEGWHTNAFLMLPPLQAAVIERHEHIVRLLLENGADINMSGSHFGTALQAAATEGHESIVLLLLENGADVNIKGGLYGSAIEAAQERGHEGVVKLLTSHGAAQDTEPES